MFAKIIAMRDKLKKRGLMLGWVADQLGINRNTLGMKLNGTLKFNKLELEKLEELLK